MFRLLIPAFAAASILVGVPTIASADEHHVGSYERQRAEHERLERERFERERLERVRREREHRERERAHERMCFVAARDGAPRWRLREMGCFER